MSDTLIEAIGYIGSALIILSLMQKSILRLRTIGAVASLTFLGYSVLIQAYPIAVVNVVAAGIHLYYLRKLVRFKEEIFSVLRVRAESNYLAYFLDFYKDEIARRNQPDFVYEPAPETFAVFLLRDMVPAGLFVAKRHDDRTLEVQLDFVIPQYRDFKLATWLYSEQSGMFSQAECRCAWVRVTTEEQETYFTRMGFAADPTPAIPERYSFRLAETAPTPN
ncbi:MAG: hypothetical protein U9N84_06405 [Actinomycetota bacterium]|nr:hypothetical protein [Actinomycetota bacterium]